MKPGAHQVFDLAQRARSEGKLVTLAPSLQPQHLKKLPKVRLRFKGLAELANVVKLSMTDVSCLYPGASPDLDLDQVLSNGPSLAVVTLGVNGSILATPSYRTHVTAQPTPVIDPVGVSESYTAALIQSVLDSDPSRIGRKELRWIGQRCTLAAGITLSRLGSEPPRAAELHAA